MTSSTFTSSSDSATRLTIRRPDDWHVHLRDAAMLQAVVAHTARQFARAIVMPNLRPPITTVAAASAYRERIGVALQASGGDALAAGFTPLMTAYLTESIDPDELERGHGEGVFTAAKLYPAGATTNSDAGVRDLAHIPRVLERMEQIGMPLLIHGEVTDPAVDIFDREAVFIERHLAPLLQRHPGLKVVLEHITTAEAAAFVTQGPSTLAATITPHHLHINRNALFKGGLRPDFYCLPVAKRERHRLALRAAATSASSGGTSPRRTSTRSRTRRASSVGRAPPNSASSSSWCPARARSGCAMGRPSWGPPSWRASPSPSRSGGSPSSTPVSRTPWMRRKPSSSSGRPRARRARVTCSSSNARRPRRPSTGAPSCSAWGTDASRSSSNRTQQKGRAITSHALSVDVSATNHIVG